MKEAPFSVTMLLFALYLVAFLAGCLVAWIIGLLGVHGWVALAISGFLANVVVDLVRPSIASYMAHAEGIHGKPPTVWTRPIRYAIVIAIAVVLSLLLTLNGGGLGSGVAIGGLVGLLTTMIAGLIFMMNVK